MFLGTGANPHPGTTTALADTVIYQMYNLILRRCFGVVFLRWVLRRFRGAEPGCAWRSGFRPRESTPPMVNRPFRIEFPRC